ncbi:TPA: glycosyltransferase, partial [Escherichia coli]|nr:glycosyltransferase [Escherichia coli]
MRVILTLIIPVYNVEAYIEECLESLFPQIANSKNNDVEVIIVNDGTPDKSMDIVIHAIKKYSLERQVRVVNQCNQGLSAARNTGIRLATGDYIGFIDSDDYVSENY